MLLLLFWNETMMAKWVRWYFNEDRDFLMAHTRFSNFILRPPPPFSPRVSFSDEAITLHHSLWQLWWWWWRRYCLMHILENFKVSLFIFGSSLLVDWWVETDRGRKFRDGKLKGSWESKWKETNKKRFIATQNKWESFFCWSHFKVLMSSH